MISAKAELKDRILQALLLPPQRKQRVCWKLPFVRIDSASPGTLHCQVSDLQWRKGITFTRAQWQNNTMPWKSILAEGQECSFDVSIGMDWYPSIMLELSVMRKVIHHSGEIFNHPRANPADIFTLVVYDTESPDFNLLSDQEYSEEEEAEAMEETMEQYMSKTQTNYGPGVARPKIEEKDSFELKGQFLKELRENTFSGSDNEDANEHIEKVLEIVDLFHVPNITVDQLMLRVFPISLTGATSRWLRNEPTSSIKTWEDLKSKFLNKYCPPGRTLRK
ncbi:hypothetical protein Tco_0476129 [Tanacetum coccineum]